MCLSCVDHPSLNPNAALNSGLFGDDVDCHDRLTVLVFGFTDVVPKVNGLHVLYSHDTLGDPCGVGHTPVHQPPGETPVACLRSSWFELVCRKPLQKLTELHATLQQTFTIHMHCIKFKYGRLVAFCLPDK
uniref:Uncharacterized protein n=1 Tax=Seriola dumerili TaxID=41447 RepID=A0A3B4UCM5_SERDU